MDPFEIQIKSLPLLKPSAEFGHPETLQALLRDLQHRPTLRERIKNMTWQSKVAAALGIAASVLVASVLIVSLPSGSIAFAQVVEKLQSAETLSFDSELKSTSNGKTRTTNSRNYYMTPGKHRTEMRAGDGESSYVVFDTSAGKVLMVDDKRREARVSEVKGDNTQDFAAKAIENLRTLDEKNSRPLGEKQVDGVRARGFVIDRQGQTTTVWADATTGTPLRVEIIEHNQPEGPMEIVWTNIQLNESLDAQLFSIEPPTGYDVKPFLPVDFNASPAEFAAKFLRIYAKHMDGRFPKQLVSAGKEVADKLGPPDAANPPNQEVIEDLMQLSFFGAALRAVTTKSKQGEVWQYYPEVANGEQDKIIFWFRDKRSDKYYATFGDLRVEVVGKDDLPTDN